jgi:lactoylglutathione lyase
VPKAADIVREVFSRLGSGDQSVLDELVAEDYVNHAATPQGREGWRQTIQHVNNDIRRTGVEVHHLFGDDEFVCMHMTINGVHEASTMPLLAGVPVSNREVAWRYIHIFRIADGQLAEHWAARDDVDLLRQIGAWPRGT